MQSVLKFLKRKKEYAGIKVEYIDILEFYYVDLRRRPPLISLHAATLIDQSQHLEENSRARSIGERLPMLI